MTTLRDAAQQALEALIAATPVKAKDPQMQADAIVALRAALAEQPAKREPVAWKHDCAALLTNGVELWIDACPHCGKPRPAPQPKPAEQEAVAPQQQQQQLKRTTHPLDVPLEVFLADLTTRPANVIRLELRGLFDGEPLTVRHLCIFSREEMKRWPNFGKKCLNEVEELLRARGLRLWERVSFPVPWFK